MKRATGHIRTELAVIGAGIAGFAASIFAIKRGIETMQIGHSGALAYTTGYLDLLGAGQGRLVEDPLSGLAALRESEPEHPLARLGNDEIQGAFQQFTAALGNLGIKYSSPAGNNMMALLPAGLRKPTCSVPLTMLAGIEAAERKASTAIFDFTGLAGFSAAEFRANMASHWPRIAAHRLDFPGMEQGQLFPEVMARSLEVPAVLEELAGRMAPRLGGAEYVGLPAILGMHAPDDVHQKLEHLLGLPVFEIPTIPPAVPGIRLRERFEHALPEWGVKLEPQLKVHRAIARKEGIRLFLSGPMDDLVVDAEAVILATGRFLSGGLKAGHERLSETLFDLPVHQPEGRSNWYRRACFDPRGHLINRAGLEVDGRMSPIGRNRTLVHDGVFAAGAVLAHQDWVRQRCGAGLAIATAHRAVRSVAEYLG
ncbi:MAG TPA: anaerobic glycerol-3-phosphate dehydrogenase subunit B [Rhizobiales bacterium]|nr:anaerobic glycerol-3-phosphate dehydrogenase subunit B [Hyphomicrobiales bacterium]